MFCGQKNPQKKAETIIFKRTFSQRFPRSKQNEILVLSIVFLFKCARGGGEERKYEKAQEQTPKKTTPKTITIIIITTKMIRKQNTRG